MLKEYGRARVLATGMYGTIVDWLQGDEYCMVELDGWQHEGQIDGDRQFPYTFKVVDLEELVEVGQAERKSVFDTFDTLVISSFCWIRLPEAPIVVVRREGYRVSVIVQSCDYETNERKTIEDSEASKLLSAVFSTHADRWTEPFTPECGVLDGYSWALTIYSGNSYFECKGENVAPKELVDLLYAIADIGLPLAWNGGEMMLSSGN